MGRRKRPLFLTAALLFLGGCGGSPPKPAESPAPAAAKNESEALRELTGREAFQPMWVAARSWTPDAQPFRLANRYLNHSRGLGGKAAVWTASFASDRLHKWRFYTDSTVKTENLHLGLFASHDESFRSVSELTGQPFLVQALQTDSDQVFQTAEQNGGKAFRRKNPEEPVTLVAEYSRNYGKLVWQVYYSASPNDSRFTVYVDAATGQLIKVKK